MGKGSRTVKGKHNAAKTNKNEQKRPNIEEKLIEFSSDAEGSASDSNNAKTSHQVPKDHCQALQPNVNTPLVKTPWKRTSLLPSPLQKILQFLLKFIQLR